MNKPIKIQSEYKRQLSKEFDTSLQTVITALCYFNNSKLAKAIRQRAKELLIDEANNIVI